MSASLPPDLLAQADALAEHLRHFRALTAANAQLQAELSFEAYLAFATAHQRDQTMREQLENIIHLLNRIDK